MSTANTTDEWTGVVYSGMCWKLHSMSALPLPGIGLAQTLFGLLAALTFLLVFHFVYTNHRRSRTPELSEPDGTGGSMESSVRSERSTSGSWIAAGFAYLRTGNSQGIVDGEGGTVSFSSYFKFLNISGCWALMWVVFNLFPQLSSGRDLPTLWWHALVASIVYTFSVFLELAVVVFLLHGGVGQKAFRTAAMTCGIVSVFYGGLNLYFRLAKDMPPAHEDPNYPIGQIDFISSPTTIIFLTISSAMFAIFFWTTGFVVNFAPQAADTNSTVRRKRKSMKSTPAGPKQPEDENLVGPTEKRGYLSGSSKEWKEAASPLIAAPQPTPAIKTTSILISPSQQPSYQTDGEWIRKPPLPPSATSGSSDSPTNEQISLGTSPTEVRPSVVGGGGSPSGSGSGRRSVSPMNGGEIFLDSGSRSPSPGVMVDRKSGRHLTTPSVPRRRSVVYYSLFLALYYTIKTSGLICTYFELDAGICLLDGGILLYMVVYAFLLYWTLVQDSKYWNNILADVQVVEEEANGTTNGNNSTPEQLHPEQVGLLTESSSTGGTSSIKGGRSGSPTLGLPPLARKKSHHTNSSHLLEEAKDAFPAILATTAGGAAGAMSSPSRSRTHGRSGSVLLRDYMIPPNQLTYIRPLIIPESIKPSTPVNSGQVSRGGAAGSRVSSGGRAITNANGHTPTRTSPLVSPNLSRSGSGTGASGLALGLTTSQMLTGSPSSPVPFNKWSLSHMSSRVGAGLRVVTGASSASWSSSGRPCDLYLGRKGAAMVLVKQFTLPSLTADFFRSFQSFLKLVPMGPWLGQTQLNHRYLSQVLGICVDPPCVSLVVEYASRGLLYELLHPEVAANHTTVSTTATIPTASVAIAIPGGGSVLTSSTLVESSSTVSASGGLTASSSTSSMHSQPPASPKGYQSMTAMVPTTPTSSGVSVDLISPTRMIRAMSTGTSGVSNLHMLNLYSLCYQLAEGMSHLHSWSNYDSHPLHLSSCNLMLTDSYSILIGDYDGPLPVSTSSRKRFIPAPAWASPEVLAGGTTTRSSNVYSFGIILWELLTHQYPCVLVPKDTNLPEPSRSHSHSHSHSASSSAPSSVSGSYTSPLPKGAQTILVSKPGLLSPVRTPSTILKTQSSPSAILATPTSNAAQRQTLLQRTESTPTATNVSIKDNQSLLGDTSPTASPVSTRPPSPSIDADGPSEFTQTRSHAIDMDGGDEDDDRTTSGDDDDDDPESHHDEGPGPPPVTYVSVPLTDLKLCQRFILMDVTRPPLPLDCPPSIVRLLEQCWHENPDYRPSFGLILEYLEKQAKEDMQGIQTMLPLQLPLEHLNQQPYASYYA